MKKTTRMSKRKTRISTRYEEPKPSIQGLSPINLQRER